MTPRPPVFETTRSDVIAVATGFGGIYEQRAPRLSLIFVSGALSISGTSSAEATRLWGAPYVHESDATASGLGWEQHAETPDDAETTRQAISELRRISSLTWEQLGELFDVSRRSVHFWASGKPPNADNEQRLMQVLDVVRAANRGDARSTRAALFEVKEGTTAFALLSAERFEEARAILGVGAARPRRALSELSAAAKAARKPLPPEDLVDAQQDRVHRDRGRARAARTLRNKRRGTP
jgi:DNA-binding transcriptional regulator YiaG